MSFSDCVDSLDSFSPAFNFLVLSFQNLSMNCPRVASLWVLRKKGRVEPSCAGRFWGRSDRRGAKAQLRGFSCPKMVVFIGRKNGTEPIVKSGYWGFTVGLS